MAHEVKLGQILAGTELRDAVHVAVAPVLAGEKLAPGQHVGFIDRDSNQVGVVNKPIGIVDPFLTAMVWPGQWFYVFLYPQTITSLRHDWTHPSFMGADPNFNVPDLKASEAWMRQFCKEHDCPSYDVLVAALRGESISPHSDEDVSYRWEDDYFHFSGFDAHSAIPKEFWDHAEVLIGRKIHSGERPEYFSCSC